MVLLIAVFMHLVPVLVATIYLQLLSFVVIKRLALLIAIICVSSVLVTSAYLD